MQGVGYVNELLGRLASRKVRDHTQTNASHPFPLRRPLYADFTHDTLLASVLSALDLIPRDVKDWKISTMTPFAGRLVFERAQCDGDLGYTQRVRALLNDRVLGEWKSVEEFRETQDYAVDGGEGDWEKCGWKPADGAYGEVEEEVLDEFL